MPPAPGNTQSLQSGCRAAVPVGAAPGAEVGLESAAALSLVSPEGLSPQALWGGGGVRKGCAEPGSVFPGSAWLKTRQTCSWGLG